MNYLELRCEVFPKRYVEIVIAALAEFGFESFAETGKGFSAFIPEKIFNKPAFESLEILHQKKIKINYSLDKIPDQNWNALWESNFEPVQIGNDCYIRAPFHPALPDIKYEIIIEPKMSFGTGHHETTHMMVELLLSQNVRNKEILDMGCGTAVFAILAGKMGASKILAVDNDEWAYHNSIENIDKNKVSGIEVILGDASVINNRTFDLILANINRNVLLQDMTLYASALKEAGIILMSGFYENDLTAVSKKAEQCNLQPVRYCTMNHWCAAVSTKK